MFQDKYDEAQQKTFNMTYLASLFTPRRHLKQSGSEEPITDKTKGDEFEAVYPDPFMSKEIVQSGGFLIYFAGIMYSFLGISLVTQNYINPAIDTIKKKGIVSALLSHYLLCFYYSLALIR